MITEYPTIQVDWSAEMHPNYPDWELYERKVASLVVEQLSTDYCVTPNAHLKGLISGRSRQVDILIDTRHDTDNTRRIIVDAKKWRRKIDVTDVEAFRGLMDDVGASHGYLVCPSGYTAAAEKRAQDVVSIRLMPLNRLDDFDPSSWPKCLNSSCSRGHIFWDGYPEISLALLAHHDSDREKTKNAQFLHYVGKCDRCGQFHVKCLTCGDILSPTEKEHDIGHQCRCLHPWFWLASIEPDEQGRKSAELHAVLGADNFITVDRRGL